MMKNIKEEILDLYDSEANYRRNRLIGIIEQLQQSFEGLNLEKYSLEIDLSASNRTLHKNKQNPRSSDWDELEKHCESLNMENTDYFHILASGRVAINVYVPRVEDLSKVASALSKLRSVGFCSNCGYLYFLGADILVLFWLREK